MQGAIDLLSSLYQRGVKLWLKSGELRYQARKGSIHPEEIARVRELRGEIVTLLRRSRCTEDDPLEPRGAEEPVPLAAAQLRCWNYYVQYQNGAGVRACAIGMRISGPLDVRLLRRCIETVVDRHESLRTRIVVVEGVPWQRVEMASMHQLDSIDMVGVTSQSAEAKLMLTSRDLLRERINISLDPLFKATIITISEHDHALVLALDHLIADNLSKRVLSNEIWALYDQGVQGKALWLPHPRLQFADYVVWQQRRRSALMGRHALYWKDRFAGAPHIEIPCDTNLKESPVGATLEVGFGHELSLVLRDAAQRERMPLALVTLTAYLVVMSRWCKQEDLIVLFVSHGRHYPQLSDMIGFLAKALYLRVVVSREATFSDLMRKISVELHSAHDHQDGVPDSVPIEQVGLDFNWVPAWFGSDQWETRDRCRVKAFPLRVDLPLQRKLVPLFYDTGLDIRVSVTYRSDLFALSTIERFVENLRLCVDSLARRPWVRADSVRVAW